jgi:hypothetical protein
VPLKDSKITDRNLWDGVPHNNEQKSKRFEMFWKRSLLCDCEGIKLLILPVSKSRFSHEKLNCKMTRLLRLLFLVEEVGNV